MNNVIYKTKLIEAMEWLGKRDVLFIGQAVRYAGTGLYDSLLDVPDSKKMEFPVAENFQVGFCHGMAINGIVPICLIPRWNFLLCATDQIINHLDKMPLMSDYKCTPKMIIRVAVGSENPVDPQDQHKGNFSESFRLMCKTIKIVECLTPDSILPAYQDAYYRNGSTIIVENPDYGK